MMNLKRCVAATSITMLSLTAAPILAADAPATKDLKDFSCKEIMIQSGSDRDISIAFVHGYMLGKNKTTQYEIDKLAKITDAFLDYCLDNPGENALASFEKVYK
jgi:hypothetical protein